MPRWIIYTVVAAIVAAGGYWAYQRTNVPEGGGSGRGGPGGRPVYVVTEPVSEQDFAVRIETVGTAKAREAVVLTAKTTDVISAINFQDGQQVPKGFVVAELNATQQSAQLAEARAALREAEGQFDRARRLAAGGNASQALLDQRRAARDTMAARVQAQESQIADRLIRAPFAGVMGLRQVSVGTLVRPGDPIATLDDVGMIKLDATVPETALPVLKTGVPVAAKSAGYPDMALPGVLTGIDSRVDPVARTVIVRIEVANPDAAIKPGMMIVAVIEADLRRSLAVPEEAIVALGEERFVFLAQDGKAERRPVRTGRRKPGWVEIVSGLRPGDRVVTEGVVKLRPGAPVTLTPPGPGQGSGPGRKRPETGGAPAASR